MRLKEKRREDKVRRETEKNKRRRQGRKRG